MGSLICGRFDGVVLDFRIKFVGGSDSWGLWLGVFRIVFFRLDCRWGLVVSGSLGFVGFGSDVGGCLVIFGLLFEWELRREG